MDRAKPVRYGVRCLVRVILQRETRFCAPTGLCRGPFCAAGHRAGRSVRFFWPVCLRRRAAAKPGDLALQAGIHRPRRRQGARAKSKGRIQRLAAAAPVAGLGSGADTPGRWRFSAACRGALGRRLFRRPRRGESGRCRDLSGWAGNRRGVRRRREVTQSNADSHHYQDRSRAAVSSASCRCLRRAHNGVDRPDAVFEESVSTCFGRCGSGHSAAGDAGRMGGRIAAKILSAGQNRQNRAGRPPQGARARCRGDD